jgi:alpha 1,3-glucosidase
MCLTLSISGISQCGADVGGFFGNPDPDLLLRWYQAAAFQPFFRAHAHIETKRREPWLFGDHMTALIRSAVKKRYALLPYWYTLFYQNELTGAPPMRPLWAEYPEDVNTFAIQDQHLIGKDLLVHPVTDKGASTVLLYLPQGIWYDFYKHKAYAAGSHSISVTEETIPVFQRGGSIIPTKQRVRRASALMKSDPYTLYVAVDQNGYANGTLYIDDEESYEYRKGKYLLIDFEYKNNELKATIKNSGEFKTKEWIERVVIVGLTYKPSSCQISSPSVGTSKLEFESYDPLVIRKPAVLVSEDWKLTLTT